MVGLSGGREDWHGGPIKGVRANQRHVSQYGMLLKQECSADLQTLAGAAQQKSTCPPVLVIFRALI